ncbi:MAG: DUF4065 domain-containing protein [Proteobacteria bacterium]|nr:DUF4065 domain-containing protein [Pseudomonadota bacterium]
MSLLIDFIAYIYDKYTRKEALSDARMVKTIYLADWLSAVETGKQLTDIRWKFDNYGPYVKDVVEAISGSDSFEIVETKNFYGAPKKQVERLPNVGNTHVRLKKHERETLDKVLEETQHMYFRQFIDHVYGTYPVLSQPKGSYLDLVELAKKQQRELLG